MKNRSSKTILVFLALGLISCAFCAPQAQADLADPWVITFTGGAQLDTDSVMTAQQVTTWLDENNALPTVTSVSGVFADFVGVGHTVTFANNWSFNSGATAFWTVDGFTFDLITSRVIVRDGGFLSVMGSGVITGHGYTFDGTWRFSTQDDPSNGVFSWSGSTVPDGGITVAMLGLALAGIEVIRRKVRKAKS
jgi:hypothetical protein